MIGVGVSITGGAVRRRSLLAPGSIPVFRAAGTLDAANAIASTIEPGLPAGWQQNDVFILLTECTGTDTVPVPDGFSEVSSSPQFNTTSGSTRLGAFWRRAGASEVAPTVTRVGDHTAAVVLAFSGCTLAGNPIDASAGDDGTGTSITIPGLTTTVANCLVVDLVSHGIDSAAGDRFSGWTNASLGSPTIAEILDVITSAGSGGGMGAACGGRASAGVVSATTVTLNSAEAHGRIKIALKPLNT